MTFACDDVGAARASRQRILELDFDRLVVAHGNVIDVGAKARLASVFAGALPHAMARA
jgi:glyoxylase-like metal-dependent hydrolase (beta-lactamase superfamily II)